MEQDFESIYQKTADVFVASNGYLFYNKILEEGYIGLGSERASYLSESMQKGNSDTYRDYSCY